MNKQTFRLLIIAVSLITVKNIFCAADQPLPLTLRQRAASVVQMIKKATRDVVAEFGYDQSIRLEENLLRAVAIGDTERVLMLSDLINNTNGADINYVSPTEQVTAFELANMSPYTSDTQKRDILTILRQYGARTLPPREKIISIFYDAARSGNESLIASASQQLPQYVPQELLADMFVEALNMINKETQSEAYGALIFAAERLCTEAELLHAAARLKNMYFFGKFASDPVLREMPDADGNTVLMEAAKSGHLGLVNLLIIQGADIFATNNAGQTAKQIALKNGHGDIAFRIDEEALDQAEQENSTQHHSGKTSATTSQSAEVSDGEGAVMTVTPVRITPQSQYGSPSLR